MKTIFFGILVSVLLCLYSFSSAASNELPEAVLCKFGEEEWKGYEIPEVTRGDELYGSQACYYYDEFGNAACFLIMKKDTENILCILEKIDNQWIIVGTSTLAILQGNEIPLITSEEYGEFWVTYIGNDGHVKMGFMAEKQEDTWYVRNLHYIDSNGYISIYVYENRLEFLSENDDWRKTTVFGAFGSDLKQFNIQGFPLTIDQAKNCEPSR